MIEPTTTPTTETPGAPKGVSQAAIFAGEYAKNAASEMLSAIRKIGRNSSRIATIALGASMPHQMSFLLALATPWLHWGSFSAWLESLGMVLIALAAPVVADLVIVSCIQTLGAVAADLASKKRAIRIMIIPTFASGATNFLAPAPWLIKILATFVVTMIPMAEMLRFIKPDFQKLEEMETGVEKQLTRSVAALEAAAVVDSVGDDAGVDMKQVNKQRVLAAQKARELALTSPSLSAAMLMRATGCGRGAAKKALEAANASQLQVAVVEV